LPLTPVLHFLPKSPSPKQLSTFFGTNAAPQQRDTKSPLNIGRGDSQQLFTELSDLFLEITFRQLTKKHSCVMILSQGTDLKSVPWLNSVPTASPKVDMLHIRSSDGKEKNR